MRGLFIAFEGPDGSGKSSVAEMCFRRLSEMGIPALKVREPGGTPFGERVREILLSHSSELEPWAELFLFMAARAQLCRKVIAPALERGETVLCDRFLWSSAAYQGAGLDLGMENVLEVGRHATGGLEPDLYVVLDVPPDVGFKRRSEHLDRIEARDVGFFERLREAYRALAKAHADRARLVDGSMPLEDVFAAVWREVEDVLRRRQRA